MKDLLDKPGAVQPWLPDSHVPTFQSAFGDDKRHWVFWQSLPDTNKSGEAISDQDFEYHWASGQPLASSEPRKELIHHLLLKHAGELIQVGEGCWRAYDGSRVPPELLLPQYSIDEEQYHMVKGKGSGKASGGSKGGKGCKKKPPLHRGKGSKQAQSSASGDDESFAWVGFENRIVRRISDRQYVVWESPLMSLPRLFHSLGRKFTATELYDFWCHSKLRALHRPHAWASMLLQDAAYERFKSTGYWGHPRNQKPSA